MTKTHSTIVVIDEWDSSNGKHYRMIEDSTLNDPYKLQYQEEQCQGQYDWLNEDPTYFDAVLADRIQIINKETYDKIGHLESLKAFYQSQSQVIPIHNSEIRKNPVVSTLCMECKKPMLPEYASHFSYCRQCLHDAVETILQHTHELEHMEQLNATIQTSN